MAKTTATYDDGDAASSVLAYTDADGAKAPAGVCAYVSGATAVPVTSTNRLPVTLGLTDAELRASAVAVSLSSTTITGTVGVSIVGQAGAVTVSDGGGSLTVDGTVGVSGSVAVTGTFWQATQPVSGPLTDSELRATAVPVSLTSTTVTGTVAVTQSGSWAVTLGAGTAAVGTVTAVGAAAHDSPVSGNPVLKAGVAANGAPSNSAAVAAGDVCQIATTTKGVQWVSLAALDGSVVSVESGRLACDVFTQTGTGISVTALDQDEVAAYPLLGTFISTPDGCVLWNNLRDSSGNELASATTTPGASDRGLVVRQPEPQTLAAGQVSVTASATQIVAARSGRRAVVVTQHGTTAVYLGPSGVTTSTGLLLTGTAGAVQVLPGGAAVFGITVSGSQTVSYAEVY
jgi:hypothetical protein